MTVGHDWGGILSLGWAMAHRDQLRGVVVGNTAVAQPPGDLGPPLIRLAHLPGVRSVGCVATPLFVRGTTALSHPPLPREIRDALALPYGTADRRRAVGAFVADIPFSPGHPSYPAVAACGHGRPRSSHPLPRRMPGLPAPTSSPSASGTSTSTAR